MEIIQHYTIAPIVEYYAVATKQALYPTQKFLGSKNKCKHNQLWFLKSGQSVWAAWLASITSKILQFLQFMQLMDFLNLLILQELQDLT